MILVYLASPKKQKKDTKVTALLYLALALGVLLTLGLQLWHSPCISLSSIRRLSVWPAEFTL